MSSNVLFEEIYQKECSLSVPDSELSESMRVVVADFFFCLHTDLSRSVACIFFLETRQQSILMHKPGHEDHIALTQTFLFPCFCFVLGLIGKMPLQFLPI